MKYEDRVYGSCLIEDPLVLELIHSHSLQRLRKIDQGGYKPLWTDPDIDCGPDDHTRFAHSLGVFLLLQKYGASREEQIAGLLHDVSHSAFSHCIDYVLETGSQTNHSHQDSCFESYVKRSELPCILQKHGIDVNYVLDDAHFPLKEKKLPDLCADRIDYSLRTAVIFKEVFIEEVSSLLNNLIVHDGQWIFTNFEYAKKFAELFLMLNRKYFSGFSSAVMFASVGNCLKHACAQGYITQEDLYTTDQLVLDKLKGRIKEDPMLNTLWRRMNKLIKTIDSKTDSGTEVFCKSRVVDPLFKCSQGFLRVSDVDPSWAKTIQKELAPKRYVITYER
jgi:HD superfamily phosphohydrolase